MDRLTLDGVVREETSVEDDFLCGVAISVYQNSGGPGTNWEAFERQRSVFGHNIENGDTCGRASDFWNNFEADIQRAADLNCKVFRLSLEWSRIIPQPGVVDVAAVQRYHQIFDSIERCGMQSLVTLYHFVHPLWFDQRGHFEKEGNISHFVDYAEIAVKHFGRRSRFWVTFNEANVQSFCSYFYGSFPPAKRFRFEASGRYFLHIYQAHVAAYETMKAAAGTVRVEVGIVHNFMEYEPQHPLALSAAWVKPITDVINKCWGNEITIEFFKTGRFAWPKFIQDGWEWQNPGGKPPCDFVGVNYYGRGIINWKLQPAARKGDVNTDMPFAAYPPGLYRAIAAMSRIGLPVWVTETGICDHTAAKRPWFFSTHLDEIVKAVEDGHDVRGLTYWTLVDNFEWAYGWSKKFGLYRWDHDDPDNRRTLNETSKELANMYKDLPARIRAARQQWAQRKLAGDTAPRHVPPPEVQAKERLKHGHARQALKTHQVGIL